jgi:hypothetical protein
LQTARSTRKQVHQGMDGPFDAMTLARFAGLLQAKGKPYQFASQSEATLADLQSARSLYIC